MIWRSECACVMSHCISRSVENHLICSGSCLQNLLIQILNSSLETRSISNRSIERWRNFEF